MTVLFAFLHHMAAFVLFGSILVEMLVVKQPLTADSARQLLRTDSIVGAAAGVVLVVGVLRVIYFEKGWDYYSHSVPFMAKITLFVLVALLSIYPTMKFMAWRSAIKQGQAPAVDPATLRTIRIVLHTELAGIAVLILMAAMMARGVGMIE